MKDRFGQELAVGDTVAFKQSYYAGLMIGVILTLGKKMIRVATEREVESGCSGIGKNVYPCDTVKKP